MERRRVSRLEGAKGGEGGRADDDDDDDDDDDGAQECETGEQEKTRCSRVERTREWKHSETEPENVD